MSSEELRGAYGMAPEAPRLHVVPTAQQPASSKGEEEEALPLPKWVLALYFLLPIVLYVPDAIFNFFVYSDGVTMPSTTNALLAVGQVALWAFLSVGVVGMAYLLSVLAPWHWVHRHRMQAFFCGVGVVVATAITTWNSLSFRSTAFQAFPTDQWAYTVLPWLQQNHVSVTMILAAVAPPFWGLFWAIVQPTQRKGDLAHLEGSHAERMLKLRQGAELKAAQAEANAKVRAAQLAGMAATANAARQQAGNVAASWRGKGKQGEQVEASALPEPVAVVEEVEEAPDSGLRLRPAPEDYSLPGSMSVTPGALGLARGVSSATPRASTSAAPRDPVGRPTPRASASEPSVADPIAAQGHQPAHVTNPNDLLAPPPARRRSNSPRSASSDERDL